MGSPTAPYLQGFNAFKCSGPVVVSFFDPLSPDWDSLSKTTRSWEITRLFQVGLN